MKQRLGIAHALLGDPSVLILDEPANGLDPAGIRWMRGLLKGYAERGGTVLLSSHLLHEVELIADEMILIGQRPDRGPGRQEVAARRAARAAATTLVTALDNDELSAALSAKGLHVSPAGDGLRVEAATVEVGRARGRAADRAHRPARGDEGGLEDLFLELTSDTQRDDLDRRSTRHEHHAPSTDALDVSRRPAIPFSRLVSVELRKMVDTRAGRWLLISIAGLTALVLVDPADRAARPGPGGRRSRLHGAGATSRW